jgi:hypothetical protein
MREIAEPFAAELGTLWSALVADLGVPAVQFVVQPGAVHAFLQEDVLVVPEAHARHFSRFGNLPTALVRDMAYAAKKWQMQGGSAPRASVEADALAYAELFLRASTMHDTD